MVMRSSTSNNYRRGYYAERKAAEALKKEGYFVVRAAGSRGPVDLVALGKDVRLIQVKRGKGALAEGKREIARVPCPGLKEVWIYEGRQGFRKEVV
jgi:Holliday junction resolvase